MIKIKKIYSEYYIDLSILDFLRIKELKIRVFKYLIEHLGGNYEAILNISFQEEEIFSIDLNVEKEFEEYYSHFSSFGTTEEEAINKLVKLISEPENLKYMKNKKVEILF